MPRLKGVDVAGRIGSSGSHVSRLPVIARMWKASLNIKGLRSVIPRYYGASEMKE